MDQSEPEDDMLLKLTSPGFRMGRPAPIERQKSVTFESLIKDLFNADVGDEMVVQIGFFDDSKHSEEALKSWQPPPQLPEAMDTEDLSQPVSSGITNMAQTLEYPATLQMTQEPRHPESSEASQTLPGLPVFKSCKPRALPLLETVDVDTVDEILSPLSSCGTEVTQAAQMLPQSELPPQIQLTPLSRSAPKEAKVKVSKASDSMSSPEMAPVTEIVSDIRAYVAKFHKNGGAASSNGKIQVHEAVLAMLLVSQRTRQFRNILCFCNEDGTETDSLSENFTSRDTKTMGRIWQSLKGNRNANFDTFARAMRVGRERHKDYFVYLSGGKGTKKRMFQLGSKSITALGLMSRATDEGVKYL